jgi:hypothetical protein
MRPEKLASSTAGSADRQAAHAGPGSQGSSGASVVVSGALVEVGTSVVVTAAESVAEESDVSRSPGSLFGPQARQTVINNNEATRSIPAA